MAKRITRCPSCDSVLNIAELSCSECNITIRGEFYTCRFCKLSPEHLSYLETFLRCEGNLSRMEKILNLSYPTLRNKLTASLQALGGAIETPDPIAITVSETNEVSVRRRELLEKVASGELSAEKAAIAMKEIN